MAHVNVVVSLVPSIKKAFVDLDGNWLDHFLAHKEEIPKEWEKYQAVIFRHTLSHNSATHDLRFRSLVRAWVAIGGPYSETGRHEWREGDEYLGKV